MIKIIKNMSAIGCPIWFRGRKLFLKGKYTKSFDMDNEEEAAEYAHWLAIFHPQIIDVTDKYGEGGDKDAEESNT